MLFPVGDRLVPGAAMLDVLCSWLMEILLFSFLFFFLNPTCIFFLFLYIYSDLPEFIGPGHQTQSCLCGILWDLGAEQTTHRRTPP